MKEVSGLNPVTRGAISALLGPALDPSSQTTSIVNTVDDHLFLWNARFKNISFYYFLTLDLELPLFKWKCKVT